MVGSIEVVENLSMRGDLDAGSFHHEVLAKKTEFQGGASFATDNADRIPKDVVVIFTIREEEVGSSVGMASEISHMTHPHAFDRIADVVTAVTVEEPFSLSTQPSFVGNGGDHDDHSIVVVVTPTLAGDIVLSKTAPNPVLVKGRKHEVLLVPASF